MTRETRMRTCHSCGVEMAEENLHGETVDRCSRCNGIFFDRGELESIIKLVRLFQSADLGENDIDTIPKTEKQRAVLCPEDGDRMSERDIGGITIDLCGRCGGIWLDNGEIITLKMVENHIRKNLQLYIRLGE